ncbi:transposase [Bradyrhizobium archetypum]|uniref:transposase n=1 Tax=Bradyrhizobium archetypum TaxID=2721160 RepID=UPI001F235974|nr:transposase [Bradyrhizobium archetypum]
MIVAVAERLEGAPRQLGRRWSDEFKAQVVAEALEPGGSVSESIHPSQLFTWRRDARASSRFSSREAAVGASVCHRRAPKTETVAIKTRASQQPSPELMVNSQRFLATTRHIVEAERPSSIRAKEDINRFVLQR